MGSTRLRPAPSLGSADSQGAKDFGSRFKTTQHVAFVVNNDRFFLTHRASWATALQESGASVTVIAQDTGYAQRIQDLGFNYTPMHFGRESVSPAAALLTSFRLLILLLKSRPSTVFLVATAAYTIGWPSALFLRRTRFIRVVTGAGRALQRAGGRSGASALVRLSLFVSAKLKNVHSLFQIAADYESFVTESLTVADRSVVIPGTGLDVDIWQPADRTPVEPPVVLFAARLFREKGIYEFIELARSIPQDEARFIVVGKPDTGVASSVQPSELHDWQREGIIDYHGEADDMLSVYQNADILLLPSTHPEGTPRVLIEAAACGVVAIASDQEGCRSVVSHGETGLIADVSRTGEVEFALRRLLEDPGYRATLAIGARRAACEKFSLEVTLTQIYGLVGIDAR